MKRCLVWIAALGLLSPAPIACAQQDSRPADNKESIPPLQLENGTILYLELSKTIDARKARIGDEVTAFLLADVVSHGKLAVRRDSKLIGHVTEARARTKENPESRLAFVFDRIIAKHGPEIKISSALLALRPAPRLETEPPPTFGPRGPNSGGVNEWSYANQGSSPRIHTSLGQDPDISTDSRTQIDLELLEIDGLSLQPTPDGSDKVVVSSKRTVKLESRMRLELRVASKTK